MLFLELQNKQTANNAQGVAYDASRKNRQLQSQVGVLRQDSEDAKQNVAVLGDATKRVDPKLAQLNRDLGDATSDLGSRVATVKDTLRQTTARLGSVEIKADQALSNDVVIGASLARTQQALQTQVVQLGADLGEITTLTHAVQADARRHEARLQGHLGTHDTSLLRFAEALSGNIKLYAESIAANLSAAALNAAAVGTFTRDLTVSLVSEIGEENLVRYVHPWALLPVVISSEVAADPDIDAAIVQDHDDPLATPQFMSGLLHLMVIFDTDAGVTKTYAAEDELTITVKVSADSKLLGWPVTEFVMTYTVIA